MSEPEPDEENGTRPQPGAESPADPELAEGPGRPITPVQAVADATADWAKDAPNQAALADLEPPPQPTPPAPPACLNLADWLQAAAATHPGKVRSGNEDRFLLQTWGDASPAVVAAVFDGMGGHGGGDLAAQIACHSLRHHLEVNPAPDSDPDRFEALLQALYGADLAIHWRARRELGRGGMGTTAVVAMLTPDGALHMYCGDSRLYHYRDGKVIQQTKDHTIVQVLLDHGKITPEEAATHPMRAQLTSCLGGGGDPGNLVVEPTWNREGPQQTALLGLRPGDVLLLCSDGLCGEVPAEELDRLAADFAQDPKALVEGCIQAALDAGGRDNVTVIALRWGQQAHPGAADQPETDTQTERNADLEPDGEMELETDQQAERDTEQETDQP